MLINQLHASWCSNNPISEVYPHVQRNGYKVTKPVRCLTILSFTLGYEHPHYRLATPTARNPSMAETKASDGTGDFPQNHIIIRGDGKRHLVRERAEVDFPIVLRTHRGFYEFILVRLCLLAIHPTCIDRCHLLVQSQWGKQSGYLRLSFGWGGGGGVHGTVFACSACSGCRNPPPPCCLGVFCPHPPVYTVHPPIKMQMSGGLRRTK